MSDCRHFALIGHPLGHSLSKALFDDAFDGRHDYRLIDIDCPDSLRRIIGKYELSGFNVTIPYKIKIISMLDRLSEEAREVGAINCVRVEPDGSLTGHNTDSEAFLMVLHKYMEVEGPSGDYGRTKAFILGTGGAAKAVAAAFRRIGVDYCFVSRNAPKSSSDETISYDKAYSAMVQPEARTHHQPTTIIVNATPVGMAPRIEQTPWAHPELLSEKHLVCDLTYNPSPTRFMREAAEAGATVKDGVEMLKNQARLSWEFWGITP